MPSLRILLDALKTRLATLRERQSSLITAPYQEQTPNDTADRIVNPLLDLTAYELRHLVVHLEASGRGADVHL